jgi:hypothetical protein
LTSEHEDRIIVEKIVGLESPEATMLITLDKIQIHIKPARPHTNHQQQDLSLLSWEKQLS